MYEDLALLAGFALCYSIVAGRVERSWLSGPILFTLFGLLIGPFGLHLLSFETDRQTIRDLSELTLALVLFTDAAGVNLGHLRKTMGLPVRLLLFGLPLTILFGFGCAALLAPKLSLLGAALVATILAPTDAALGKAVVTNEAVPEDIRQGLNVESGLNDGICVPIMFVFLELAIDRTGHTAPLGLALKLVAEELGIGLLVGLGMTLLAGLLLRYAGRKGWLTHTWIQVPVVALAFCCFGTAQFLGGSGFIAAFTGGLMFGALAGRHREEFLMAAEGTGDVFAMLTWVIFGSAVVGAVLDYMNWKMVAYALLSLTLIRMLPVFIVLTGSGLSTQGKLFIGWFGPRGLASIVFTVILVDANLPESIPLAFTVVITIILSILGHGMSATPWASIFGRENRMR